MVELHRRVHQRRALLRQGGDHPWCALLARVEECHRSSARRFTASGFTDAAVLAEEWAEAIRFDLQHPISAGRVRTLLRQVDRRPAADGLCAEALRAALRLTGADQGNIQLRDPGARVLRIAAHQGFDREFLEHFEHVECSGDDGLVCGRAARRRSQTIVVDVDKDEGFEPHREIAAASGFRAVCSTPLTDRYGTVVGVLSVHFPRPHRPSEQELRAAARYGQLLGPMVVGLDAPVTGEVLAVGGP